VALVEAIELSDSAGYTAAKGAFIGALAEVDAMQGDVSGALARLERGENTMRAAGDRVELSKYLARWAWVLARAEERERAERHLAEASQLVREAGVSSVSEAGQLVGRARQVLA
jgi:hypothetical protein